MLVIHELETLASAFLFPSAITFNTRAVEERVRPRDSEMAITFFKTQQYPCCLWPPLWDFPNTAFLF